MIKHVSKSKLLHIFFIIVISLSNYVHGINESCNESCTSTVNYDCECCNNICGYFEGILPCDRSMDPCKGAPFLQYKSQGLNKAKDLVGLQQFIHQSNMPRTYGTLYSSVEVTRTFRSHQLAQYLFGDDLINCNTLLIQGSAIQDRHPKAWLADYFGLPIDFDSTVNFCPEIKNVIVDINSYFGLTGIAEGLYLKIHLPLVCTSWSLNMSECVKNPGQEPFPEGYMSIGTDEKDEYGRIIPSSLPREFLPCNFIDAMQPGTTFGDQKQSMFFGLMECRTLKKESFADLSSTFGWDFILKDDGHLGINVHGVAPTGIRPTAKHLFEPIIGNGKHWELGAGVTGSWIFWRSSTDKYRHAGIWFDATITHMFKGHQARSFDFCNKSNSRYMLLIEMISKDNLELNILGSSKEQNIYNFVDPFFLVFPIGGDIDNKKPTIAKYINNIAEKYIKDDPVSASQKSIVGGSSVIILPAINYTTRLVDSQINIQVDAAVKLSFIGEAFSFDIGYEFWMRTEEKFTSCRDYCNRKPFTTDGKNSDEKINRYFAIKGDGFIWNISKRKNTSPPPEIRNLYFQLSGSQSKADIHSGENMKLPAEKAAKNMGVDNPQFGWGGLIVSPGLGIAYFLRNYEIPATGSEREQSIEQQIYSSFQPVLLSTCDLDTCRGPKTMSHKLFTHLNYTWKDQERRWTPFAGLGGEIEFAPRNRKYRAASQWGVWLKAGAAFH